MPSVMIKRFRNYPFAFFVHQCSDIVCCRPTSRQKYFTRFLAELRRGRATSQDRISFNCVWVFVGRSVALCAQRCRWSSRSLWGEQVDSKQAGGHKQWADNFAADLLSILAAASSALCLDVTARRGAGNWRWGTSRVAKVFYALADFDGVLTAAPAHASHVCIG